LGFLNPEAVAESGNIKAMIANETERKFLNVSIMQQRLVQINKKKTRHKQG
jgi:hypothetical protein